MGSVTYREVTCKSALNRVTGMPFEWSLNPYSGCAHGCVYCYARAYHLKKGKDPGAGFDSEVEVKVNFAAMLREELRRGRDGLVALGTATDPYQPCEGRYRLTRDTLAALVARPLPLVVVTKNPMVVRDADLLQALARRVEVTVYFSITTLDRELWRKLEPRTAPPEARLRALAPLRARGVDAGVLCAPIVPDLTDSEASLLAVARAAKAHGAVALRTRPLKLDPGVKDEYLGFLAAQFPTLLPQTIDRYAARGAHAHPAYLRELDARVERVRALAGFTDEPAPRPRAPMPRQLQLALR